MEYNIYYQLYNLAFYMFCVYYHFVINNNCTIDLDNINNNICSINFNTYNNILLFYFIIDTFFINKSIDLLHHSVSIILVYLFNPQNIIYVYILKLLLLTETSSMFLSLSQLASRTVKIILKTLFAILFLTIRTYVYYCLNFKIYNQLKLSNTSDLVIIILIKMMTLLHIYWSYLIIYKLVSIISKKN